MSELSTADLAGGTTPRTRATDPAIQTRDPRMDTGDPSMHDSLSDPAMDNRNVASGATGVEHADLDARETVGRQMPTTGSPSSRLANPAATDGATPSSDAALFPVGEAEGFRSRWTEVQTGFVDEPRSAVEDADSLVAEMMQRLAKVFAEERARLEEQWSRGDDISTEDLRQALRRYRSFFDRLLSV